MDLASKQIEDILYTEDLWARSQGIASWSESATYIIQPISPDLPFPNQVRMIDLNPNKTLDEFLKEIKDVFGEYGIRVFQIKTDKRTKPPHIGEFLKKNGFKELKEEIFIKDTALEMPQMPIHLLEAEKGSVMNDFENINDTINAEKFDGISSLQMAEVRKFRRETGLIKEFVAYFRGEPAGTVSVISENSIVSLKEIKVLEKFRKDQIEKGIIASIILEYFSKGLNKAAINSEDIDYKVDVLLDLGFHPVTSLASYLWNSLG